MSGHLHRAWYRTDATEEEPEYVGAFSGTIPDTALRGRTIVGVDWSKQGWVEVTFLLSGPGHDLPGGDSGER
jgi:hypothetical protein